jgi:hypothetical protein
MNEEELTNNLDYHDAVKAMHNGNVVQYTGTVNGNVFNTRKFKFCMLRGVILDFVDGEPVPKSYGTMVYDPDFRYKLAEENVDTKKWFDTSS